MPRQLETMRQIIPVRVKPADLVPDIDGARAGCETTKRTRAVCPSATLLPLSPPQTWSNEPSPATPTPGCRRDAVHPVRQTSTTTFDVPPIISHQDGVTLMIRQTLSVTLNSQVALWKWLYEYSTMLCLLSFFFLVMYYMAFLESSRNQILLYIR